MNRTQLNRHRGSTCEARKSLIFAEATRFDQLPKDGIASFFFVRSCLNRNHMVSHATTASAGGLSRDAIRALSRSAPDPPEHSAETGPCPPAIGSRSQKQI